MSTPDSPPSSTRRRPVPPPKTKSQALLRQELTSPDQSQSAASNQHAPTDEPQDESRNELPDSEARRREAMKHLTLPPGWDLSDGVDVTYHTHIAKPIVHETVYQHTTERVEPRITREIHRYHQYDHIQPLEVEVPKDSYATNAKGEIIHAPGGLGTQTGSTSYWEQERQDRGYSVAQPRTGEQDHNKTDAAIEGQEKIAGPFPIQSQGGSKGVLEGIASGGIAQRFGGSLTTPVAPSKHNHSSSAEEAETRAAEGDLDGIPQNQHQLTPQKSQVRPRGGGFEATTQQPHPIRPPQTPPGRGISHSTEEGHALPDATPPSSASFAADLEQTLNRLSLQNQPSESKPLPPLPDTSPCSSHTRSGVRRMSADNRLRERFSMDFDRAGMESQKSDD